MKMHKSEEGFLVHSSVISCFRHFRAGLLFLCLSIGSVLTLHSQNVNYYLAADGNDNSDGRSPATAWKSIEKLNEINLSPGDSVLFKGGDEFRGSLILDELDGNDPLKFLAISSYGSGKATLNGGNGYGLVINETEGVSVTRLKIIGSGMETNSQSGIYLLNALDSDFKFTGFELRELEISDFGQRGILISGLSGNSGFRDVLIEDVTIYNCRDAGIFAEGDFSNTKTGYAHENIVVRRAEIYNITGYDKDKHSGSGIVLSDTRNSLIENCVVHDSGDQNTQCGGPVGIWFFESDNVTIQHCEVYNISSGTGCDGGGFDMDGGVTNGLMQYNYSHDNDGPGFLVGQFIDSRRMFDITVRYNISENDGRTNGGGIYLFNVNPDFAPEKVSIYHNTVFASPSADNENLTAAGALDGFDLGPDIVIANNIFYTTGNVSFTNIPEGKEVSFINNLYYTEGTPKWIFQGRNYNSLESFRESGNETINGQPVGLNEDPLMENPGGGGTIGFGNDLSSLPAYQLGHRSPALNIATPLGDNNSPVDFFGTEALLGPERDLGAFELDDQIPPEITLLGDNPFTLEAGFDFEDPGAITDDGSEVVVITEGLKKQVGEYEVIYTSTDVYGNSAETSRLVTVIDTRAPEIACNEMFLELDENGRAELTEEFLTANITDPSEFEVVFDAVTFSCESIGLNPVQVTAIDAYGNTASCTANIEVVDLSPPELLTLPEDLPLQLYVAELEKLEMPEMRRLIDIRDNCTPEEEIVITQSPNAESLLGAGVYDLRITLTDASGNSTTLNFPLTISEGVPNDDIFFIYPNPVTDIVRFNKNVVRTTVFDMKGTKLLETYDPRLDVSYLQQGIYLFEVITPEGTFYKKVIKN